jgi:RoxA-like, cytochrome c-like
MSRNARPCAVLVVVSIAPLLSQTIPKAWDEAAISSGLLPPPVASANIRQVPAAYYYRMAERVMFRRYPVYSSKSEPAGYLKKLALAEPELTFDSAKLKTEEDWIAAGREVFRYPISAFPAEVLADFRGILERSGVPAASDGTYAQLTLVVQKKGVVMLGFLSCATCHTRIQPDGSVIEGGQGTVPDSLLTFPPDVQGARAFARALFRVPWLDNDSADRIQNMSVDEINTVKAAMPLGVVARHGTSFFSPAQIPDLIGLRDRRYFDHTGLMRHRDIGDLMRYAALNNGTAPAGLDMLSNFSGFIPMGNIFGHVDNQLPPPETMERHSDTQLFALAKFVYSLAPPSNPNQASALTKRGETVFAREGCARCHTPPLYTSNKLTPATGFAVPEAHTRNYDIEPTVVGTDPTLAMQTRRSTGYYKVPSLRGVWYRGPFEHNGSVATLEDWFDPKRLRRDYVPTGFKGYGIERRAVPGHPFGLGLSPEDKRSLIAFLKTL